MTPILHGERESVCWKPTDPGRGSGTLPVYSLHFESCTSMKGPSKTFWTSEKAYWQIADALMFFLEKQADTSEFIQRSSGGISDSPGAFHPSPGLSFKPIADPKLPVSG